MATYTCAVGGCGRPVGTEYYCTWHRATVPLERALKAHFEALLHRLVQGVPERAPRTRAEALWMYESYRTGAATAADEEEASLLRAAADDLEEVQQLVVPASWRA